MDLAEALLPISETDVRQAYWFTSPFPVDNAKTDISLKIATKTADGTKVICLATLHTDTGEPILDKDLERWLCDQKQLLGRTERSRVAMRVKFYIRRHFQNRGLATYIVRREDDLFRRWGAKEIQVVAMEFGRWVWTRGRFGYNIADFGFYQQKYRDWQRARGVAQVKQAKRLSDFPRDFLLSSAVSTLPLFKSLG